MNSTEKNLGELAEIFVGISGLGDSGEYAFRVIQPNSFSDLAAIESIETQYHKEDVGKKLSLQVGDILVKRLNPSYVFVVSDDEAGAVVSQNLLVVRPGSEIDPLYLACLLEQKEIISQVEHFRHIGCDQGHLPEKTCRDHDPGHSDIGTEVPRRGLAARTKTKSSPSGVHRRKR